MRGRTFLAYEAGGQRPPRAVSLRPRCAGSSTAGSRRAAWSRRATAAQRRKTRLMSNVEPQLSGGRLTQAEFRNGSGAPIGNSLELPLPRAGHRAVATLPRPVLNGRSWMCSGPPSCELFNDWYW